MSAISMPFDTVLVTAHMNILKAVLLPKTNTFSICVCVVALNSKEALLLGLFVFCLMFTDHKNVFKV